MQQLDLRPVETASLQPDDIQPGQPRAVADYAAEWNDVGLHAGDPTDHRGTADTNVLMDRRRAADHRMVGDADMTAHHRVVGDDDVVAERAIVRDMRHRHQQAVRADRVTPLPPDGAAMDGAVLAHLGARTDLAARRLPRYFRSCGARPTVQNGYSTASGTDVCVAVDHDMRYQFGPILDHHVGTDRAVGTYANSDRPVRRLEPRSRWDG